MRRTEVRTATKIYLLLQASPDVFFVFFARSWPAIVVIGTICLLLIILLCVHYVNKAF